MSALEQLPRADPEDPSTLTQLQALHPAPADLVIPNKPADCPQFRDSDSLQKFISFQVTKKKASAPGPSGWTFMLVKDLMSDEVCCRGITALVMDIVNGKLSDECAALLTGSTLFAQVKPLGGVRPLACGEVFYRLAASFVVSLIGKDARDVLAPLQLAVAVPGGCEVAVHLLQNWATEVKEGVSAPRRAVVKVDFANAFNSRRRDGVLEALYAEPSLNAAWRMADWAYKTPSALFLMGKAGKEVQAVLPSVTGVRQGCPLGHTLFALSIHPLLLQIRDRYPTVSVVAISDDLSVVCPPSLISEVFEFIREKAAPMGLKLVDRKTEVAWLHSTVEMPRELEEFARQYGLAGVQAGALDVLGAVVGDDKPKMRWRLASRIHELTPLLEKLTDRRLSAQEATVLLTQCVVAKVGYLWRCCPPSVTGEAAELFDDMIAETASKIWGVSELTGKSLVQAQLPVRLGGCGLGNARKTATEAWYCAQAQAAPFLYQEFQDKGPPGRIVETVAAYKTIAASCDPKADQLPPNAYIALSWHKDSSIRDRSKDSFSKNKLQHDLTTQRAEKEANELITTADNKSEQARLYATQASKSGLFLKALPLLPCLALRDFDYRVGVRHRLGLPPPEMPDYCLVCKRHVDISLDPWHCLNCPAQFGRRITRRHDHIVDTITSWANKIGARASREPRQEEDKRGKRPDIKITIGATTYLLDVTVRNPACPSHASEGAKGKLKVAEKAEKEKTDKYKALAEREKAKFVPFAVETFGGMGAAASEFILNLLKESKDLQHAWAPWEVVYGLQHSVAVAIQRGNASLVSAAIHSHRRRAV